MEVQFLYPYWGSETISLTSFFKTVNSNQFNGIEINIPEEASFKKTLLKELEQQRLLQHEFIVVPQQVLGVCKETPKEYLQKALKKLAATLPFQPNFINSHTGKDSYSFEDNCRVIETIENFSAQNNIPVYHEIHRGRFTFHSATTVNYLEKFPQLKLVGDLSHWCVVSESMLQDQEAVLKKVFPHIHHIHARVGFEQAPQVNHPFAPEWEARLNQFVTWWKQIIAIQKERKHMTITPEFGPFPYMPHSPFNNQPLANQTELNLQMHTYLKHVL